MVLPELSMMRRRGETLLTVCVVAGDGAPRKPLTACAARLAALSDGGMPLLDPHPSGGSEIASPAPPADYETAVAAAVGEIRAGAGEKLVLAREIRVQTPTRA